MIEILMPKFGSAMVGEIAQWIVADGSVVAEGAVIAEIDTEKVTSELESPAAGTISLCVPAGEEVAVGTVIARLEPLA